MNFYEIADLIEQAQIDEANRTAPVLSQIYGYEYKGGGVFEPIPHEARVIEEVISQIAMVDFMSIEKLLGMILDDFLKAKPQIRNRSGRRWSQTTLVGLVRPVYAGLALDSWGRLRPVSNYPAIVSREIYTKAALRLRKAGLLPDKVAV